MGIREIASLNDRRAIGGIGDQQRFNRDG